VRLEPESNDLSANTPQRSLRERSANSIIEVQEKYRRCVRWIFFSGAIALVGVGGLFVYQRFWQPAPTSVAVALIPVKRGTVELTNYRP